MDQWNAFSLIAREHDIANPFTLDKYASQDPHGGYHAAYDDGFPVGSMWRVEGQFLYALVRALKPAKVLELGTSHGCSATHILQALHDNGMGALDCVDNGSQVEVIGDMIPDALRYRVDIHQTTIEEAIEVMLKQGYQYDLIFEDGMHDAPQVELVWRAAKRLLRIGGMIVSHDAMHAIAGEAVREGITRAGYEDTMGYGNGVLYTLIAPADCGFAVWRKGTV